MSNKKLLFTAASLTLGAALIPQTADALGRDDVKRIVRQEIAKNPPRGPRGPRGYDGPKGPVGPPGPYRRSRNTGGL
jgi:hypothetical protein